MVTIERLYDFGEAAVINCDNLKSYEVVSTEAELKDLMDASREWPLLVCVLPNSTGDDKSHDNVAENNEGLFLVLDIMRESMTRDQRKQLWIDTAEGMKELKEFIHECEVDPDLDFMDVFSDMEFGRRNTQPEYNVADCSGWSLMFNYSTDWF